MLHQNPEHGPLLMTWMLMNFHVIELSEDNEQIRKFRQYWTMAGRLGVFGYLQAMCTHPVYRDKSLAATIVSRTIYNQLAFLCDIFNSDPIVEQHRNIYELLSELLKVPAIAKEFCLNSGWSNTPKVSLSRFLITFLVFNSQKAESVRYSQRPSIVSP